MNIDNIVKHLSPDCDPSTADFAVQLMKDATTFFQGPIDYSKLDQNLGLAFPAENDGILVFLRKKICVKQFENAKLEAFRLISWLLQQRHMKSYVFPFCGLFKSICGIYWSNKKESSKIQQAAVDTLIALFESFGSDVNLTDFDAYSLYHELTTAAFENKFSPSVRGKIINLLGVVASLFDDFFDKKENFERLFNIIIYVLKQQVESVDAKMEPSILLGVLKGTDRILFQHGDKMASYSDNWAVFCEILERIINPELSIVNTNPESKKLKRREFQRAGIELIGNHGSSAYFCKILHDNYSRWYEDLLAWSSSRNADDSRVGKKAMYTFLQAITSFIKTNSLTEECNEEDKDFQEKLLSFFTERFNASLMNKECSRNELTIAVKGAGLLLDVCSDPIIADNLFSNVMKHIEAIVVELNMPVTDKYSGSMTLITTYLESVGSMLRATKISDDDSMLTFQQRLMTVEQLTSLLILNFPNLSEKSKPYSHLSFLNVIQSLHSKHHKYFLPFIERVFHETLNHIIASPTKLELDILIESLNQGDGDQSSFSAKNHPLLKSVDAFAPFWVSLMKSHNEVTEAIYDVLMRWTLATIGKLDLSLEFIEDTENVSLEMISADPIYNSKPNVVRDFQLFVNLVDFLQAFVLKANTQLFAKWIEFFVDDILGYLKNNPLVSGFNKILSLIFKMTEKLEYFSEDVPERRSVFANCTAFLKGLGIRIEEFRDDLLLSVLELWLSAPDKMIMENIPSLHSTSKIVFVMGRNHFPLALSGIETVDRWFQMNELPAIEMEKLVENLFPIWKSYFISAGEELITIHQEKEKRLSTKSQSKSKIGQRRVRRAKEEFHDATLKNVQLKLLHLFGSYGHLIRLGDDIKNALSTEEPFLKYSLPFQDIKPDIYFDKLLPRILDLCHNASDRQTRSCACEFFHTLILYFLGFSVKTTGSSEHGDLFKILFKALLKFGCDSDVVVRQLFNPLAIQVVHWFTRKDNPYSDNMLRIIMDGLTQSNDAPLRDFSGVCLTEFFSWAIKHDNKENVNAVMKFLFALSTHAAPQYRQGSVLGFNSIYKDFRENDNLRNVYTLQLIYSYVTCLSLSNSFGIDTILIRSALQAIKHLERIILKKQDLFNTEMKQRKKPDDVGGYSLKHFVNWLLRQAGRIETVCRQECIRLVTTMGPVIRGIGTLEQYLRSFPPEELQTIGEAKRNDPVSFEESTAVLLQATEFYSFVTSSGYPVEKILNLADSTYLQDLKLFLEKPVEDFESSLGNVAINIFLRLENLFTHLPVDMRQSVVLNSLILSKRFASSMQTEKLCKLWNSIELPSVVHKCATVVTFDVSKISKTNVVQHLSIVRWLVVLTKGKFVDSVLHESEVLLLCKQVWNFILENLFVKGKGGGLETVPISLRMAELLQCMLELCISLKLESNKLIEIIFDPTTVTSRDTKLYQKFTKGEIFQKTLFPSLIYCEDVMDFDQLKNRVSMENVGSLAQNLLQAVKNKKELRKKFGTKLVDSILAIWTPLQLNCDRRIVARILGGLASINLNMCRNSLQVSQWWSNIMTVSYLSLKEKSELINLFGLFALSSDKEIVNISISAVHTLVKVYITPQMKWTEEENYITRIAVKLLSVYEHMPKNLELVEILTRLVTQVSVTQESGDNSCEKEIQYKLRKLVSTLSEGGGEIAEHLYQLVSNRNDPTCRQTLAACKFCLLPVISSLPNKAVKKFYKNNFYSIIHHSKSTPTNIEEWNLKIIGFYLLELLALKTDRDFLTSEEFNQSYVNHWNETEKKENENKIAKAALRHFIAISGSYKSTAVPSQRDEKLKKVNFQCNGASFNAIAAVLKATAQGEKFYSAYVFQEQKNQILWANLVDTSITYNFPVILPQQQAKKKEAKISTNKISADELSKKKMAISANNKDALVGSSLAMEATEFDFTSSVTVENCEFYKSIFEGATAKSEGKNSLLSSSLEWNEVNQHECMVSLVETLRHMKTFESALDTDGSLIKDRWITNLCNYFNKKPHRNIQIFLIGAMLNCEDVIRPYAKHLIESILEAIFSECFGEEKLNYFVKDIFVMLLGFHEVAKPCSNSVKKALEYLINNIGSQDSTNPYATRKDVYDHNVEILQSVVKYWVTDPESEFALEYFTGRRPDVDKKYLDVCRCVLLGEKLPFKRDDAAVFLDRICKGFRNGSKNIYSTAGEIVGLTLRYLADSNFDHIHRAVALVKTKLDLQRSRHSAYLIMLSAVQKHYTPFIETQRLRLFELLQNQNFRSEAIALLPALLKEMIRKQEDPNVTMQDFYSDLNGRHVLTTACKEELEIKAGVELFKLLLENLDNEDKIMKLVKWTSPALFCKDAAVRVEYVTLLSKVYTQLPGAQQGFALSSSRKALLKMFVNLYNDEDAKVIEQSQKFWFANLQMWKKSSELILELMELIGDDENSIPISLDLIMKRCAFSPDYKKKIFDQPLADCQFLEYKLDTSWRMKNSSFQPLFAESLSSSQSFSLLPKPFQASILSQRQGAAMQGMNLLKATLANLQFTPTNQSSFDSSSLDEDRMDMDYDFSQENSIEMQHEASPEQASNPLASLRRRFYERPPVETDYYARREIDRQERQIEREIETVKKKQSGVKLSRSYRIGELPDIQISNSDLLATVSKLARSDQELGKQFLVILYTSIVEEIGEPRYTKKFLENSQITFNNVFKNFSAVMNPQFAAAVLEMSERNNIPIQANLVSSVCRTFDLQKLGIVKFENDLEFHNKDLSVATTSKRIKTSTSEENAEADLWLRIADLYKDIEGFDVLRNIFSVATMKSVNSRDVYQGAKEALTLESVGKLEEACDKYADMFETEQRDSENNSVLREQFWEDSVTKCLEKMSDWEQLYNLAHKNQTRRNLNDLLEDTSYVERVLPLQIRSGIQILLRDQSEEENKVVSKFKDFIEAARESEDNWKLLLERFPVDLALLTAIENIEDVANVARSGTLLDSAWSSALKYFQTFDRLSFPQKKDQLLMLQKSAALQDILDWHRNFDINTVTDKSFRMMKKWKRSCSSLNTPLTSVDVIVAQRDYFLLKLGHEVEDLMLENKDYIFNEIQLLNFSQHLWELNLSIINENLPVTTNCLKKVQTVGETLSEDEKIISRKLYAKHLDVFMTTIRNDDWAKMWSSLWKRIQKVNVDNKQIVWEIKADLLKSLLGFCTSGNCSKACEKLMKSAFVGKAMDDSANSKTLVGIAVDRSLKLIDSTMVNAEKITAEELTMKFYRLLKLISSTFPEQYADEEHIHKQLLYSLLRGMQLGSSEGIRLFPTLFATIEKWPSLVNAFEGMVSLVPTWMFLPWLDQIVTNYHHTPSLTPVLKGLIDRLVIDYPQAFQLQYPEILAKSKLPELYKMYSKALSALVLPKHRFNYVSDIRRSKNNLPKLLILLERYRKDLKEILDDGLCIYGKIHNDYAAELFPKVLEYIEKLNQEQLSNGQTNEQSPPTESCSESVLKVFYYEIMKSSDTMHKKVRGGSEAKKINIADLSPWLAKFHFSGHREGIEIPGLYDTFCAPVIEMHPQIISFQPTVTIESSLTEPISFTMLSNDGNNYKFLAKFGDDLRQDRRIQQCFRLANEIFKDNPRCRERNLNIVTYSVLPFNKDFGIIQWIQKTISMRRIIFPWKSVEDSRKDWPIFKKWLRPAEGRPDVPDHWNSAKTKSRGEATLVFDKCIREFNALKVPKFGEFFKQRAASIEDYFLIRENVIRSYATMCVVHWLLGIGDRHLENFIFSLETGVCIGIDFGRSFGFGITRIHIPELIPFRLTPQLQTILAPYGPKGLFKETMIYAWRALRQSSEQILSVVEVFVKDRDVNWLEDRNALENSNDTALPQDQENLEMNEMKLKIVKDKLMGMNPIKIMEIELQLHKLNNVKQIYTKVLKDGREEQLAKEKLNEEEVVEVLLDLATDKNILARTYIGMNPWV